MQNIRDSWHQLIELWTILWLTFPTALHGWIAAKSNIVQHCSNKLKRTYSSVHAECVFDVHICPTCSNIGSFRKKILQLRLTWAQRYFQLFCADLWLKPHLLIRGHGYWPVNTHLDWRLPSYNAGNQAPIKWEKHLPGPFVQSEREWPTHLQPNPCYSQAQKPQCTFHYKWKLAHTSLLVPLMTQALEIATMCIVANDIIKLKLVGKTFSNFNFTTFTNTLESSHRYKWWDR